MLVPMFDAWANLCAVNPFAWDFSHPAPRPASSVRSRAGGPALQAQRLVTDAGTLDYKLYVPSSYSGQPCPLLLMLHGCSQDGEDFARGTGMNELAEQSQCIVAYPEQSASANSARCWNWFEDAHHHRSGEPALIAGVARKVMDDYAIDADRVFIAGLSAGGAMAVVVGRNYPDLFAAVGCHSGLAYGCAQGTGAAMQAMQYGEAPGAADLGATALPLIVFHGDRDATVHPRNGQDVINQCINTSRGRRSGSARCESGQATGRSFTREIHRSPGGSVLAEYWSVHGSGHAWSGGKPQGSFTDAQGPDASREMLRFFLSVTE